MLGKLSTEDTTLSTWAGIYQDRKLPLFRDDGRLNGQFYYVDRILGQQVIPYIRQEKQSSHLQQDNAPSYRARIAIEYLRRNNVPVLEWSIISSDMNCLKKLRAVLSRPLRQYTPQPQNVDEIFYLSG